MITLCIFNQKAGRKDFKCFHRKEMTMCEEMDMFKLI